MTASGPEASAAVIASGHENALRRLYHWTLSWAEHPLGWLALFVLSFIESSFFPLPPDPLLLALCLGARSRSLLVAANCTIASVLGGLFGYWIGMNAFQAFGLPVLEFYGKVEDFEVYRAWFREQGNLAVLIAAITPVPYKLVTITAGAAEMNVAAFTFASVIGRGARFFAIAGLIWWKGEPIAGFIERHFEKLAVLFGVLLVGGFVVFKVILDH